MHESPAHVSSILHHRLLRSTWLPRPVDEVFDFFSDARNLERITPPELRFHIVSTLLMEMHAGTNIEYRLVLFGFRFRWLTEITDWDPPLRFVDRQLSGPYRHWLHAHRFTAERQGTRMVDRVDYVLPLGHLGLLARPLVARELRRIFDYRESSIQRILG